MKALCVLTVLAVLAVLAVPAIVSAGEAPALETPAALSAVPAPPTATNLADAIFADGGGLPCTHICYVSRDCGCDPPVIVECTGCQSCSRTFFGVSCDGVVHNCPPCAW
jgi:hypothetical protein